MCTHVHPSASVGELDTMRRAAEGLRLRGELAAARRVEQAVARLRSIRAAAAPSSARCRCGVAAAQRDEMRPVRTMVEQGTSREREVSVAAPEASAPVATEGVVADVGLTAADWFVGHAVRMRSSEAQGRG